MARQRPVTAVNVKPHQQRSIFSGSNNNLSRFSNYILVLAQSVHDAMVAAAATFTTPPVTMLNFQAHIDDFQAAKQALGVKGTRGSMADTNAMYATRKAVIDDLNALTGYVQAIARAAAPADDIWAQYGLIALARFAKKHQRRTPLKLNRVLPAPTWVRNAFSKKNNIPGYSRIRWNKVAGAAGYAVYGRVINNLEFIATVTSTTYSEFIGLGNNKIYVIQPIDKFGTIGGLSAPIKAIAFVNP